MSLAKCRCSNLLGASRLAQEGTYLNTCSEAAVMEDEGQGVLAPTSPSPVLLLAMGLADKAPRMLQVWAVSLLGLEKAHHARASFQSLRLNSPTSGARITPGSGT